MPLNTFTLPLANSEQPGTIKRVGNFTNNTTLRVATSGADYVGIPGLTQIDLAPLWFADFQSNGVDRWQVSSQATPSVEDAYEHTAGVLLGTNTPVPLTRSPGNVFPSSVYFTESGGDLTAIRPLRAHFDLAARYTATGNNSDFEMDVGVEVISGIGTVTGLRLEDADTRSDTVQRSKAVTGLVELDEGAVIGLRGNSLGSMSVDIDQAAVEFKSDL